MILSSFISSVTVFADRAAITRTGSAELEAGEQTLIFDDLPASIEQNSLQVSGTGNAVLGNVQFQIAYEETPEENKKSLLDEKQKLEDHRQDLEDSIHRLEKEKQFLDNISTKITTPTEETDKTELDSEKWLKMMVFYSQRLAELDKEIRQTERKKRQLNDQINKLNWQLQQSGKHTRKTKNQVAVHVTLSQAGSLTLNLTYMVSDASWKPVYDLRVASESKQMAIAYNAHITQTTGETWENATLKLSTARPQVSGYQPELTPWRLSVYVPKPAPVVVGGAMSSKTELSRNMFSENAPVMSQMFDAEESYAATASPELETTDAIAETGATAVLFAIAGKHTVQPDGSEYKVNILNQEFSAHFRYSTVPKLSPFAYLKAKVTNRTEFPLLAGEAHVFLDNHFIANTHLKTVAPTEEFWTYLGIDESMKVEHKFLKKYEKKETQLFAKNRKVLVYEYQITIKNHKKTQEEIVVWDQLPISGNEQIKVQLLEPAFKENSDSLKKNELEYLEWFFKPNAGEEILIPFKFTVEFPQDVQVSGLV